MVKRFMTFIINTINRVWIASLLSILFAAMFSTLFYNPSSNLTLYIITYLLLLLFYMSSVFLSYFYCQTEEQKKQKAFLYIRRDDKHENR